MIIIWKEYLRFDLNHCVQMYHEKKLAESSELAERGCGGEEEKRERDLDDVGGLGKMMMMMMMMVMMTMMMMMM